MNPYKILDIDRNATKREIINSVTLSMRQRRFSAREVAEAQKELMNPITKAAQDFINFIEIDPLLEGLDLATPAIKNDDNIRLMDIFDNE